MSENSEGSSGDEFKSCLIILEKEKDEWIVRNQGDSAVLFRAGEKEPALKFANEMSEQHGIDLKVVDEEKLRNEEELKTDQDIIVRPEDGKWIVCHDHDTAVLFSAPSKEQALQFARDMSERHGIQIRLCD